MDESKFELVQPEQPHRKPQIKGKKQRPAKRRKWPLLCVLLLLLVAAGGSFYYWAPENLRFWQGQLLVEELNTEATEIEEVAEDASGLSVYRNEELGFSFSYPAEWGEVEVSDEPFAPGEEGSYLVGYFTTNEGVRFGGPALGYTAANRGGVYLDVTGWVSGAEGYYSLYAAGDVSAQPIEGADSDSFELVEGVNTTSLLYTVTDTELLEPAAIGLVNLGHADYPGLTFVMPLGEDAAAAKAALRELLVSLQLL